MDRGWADFDRAAISRRYDGLAGLIPLFEWLLFLPPGLRKRAAESLRLRRGDRVLEVGCGTGRNFRHLYDAVGPSGRIYGVDISGGMLQKASRLCKRQQWRNVVLTHADIGQFKAPDALDGVLFGLSYNTISHHRDALQYTWTQLRRGGRVVIMDAKVPRGSTGRLVLPFGAWLMKRTLLGNPYIRPWDDLEAIAGRIEMEEFLFGSYYICSAVKR